MNPVFKITFIFAGFVNTGWSETFYWTGISIDAAYNAAAVLANARAAILGTGATLQFIRISQFFPTKGPSRIFTSNLPGQVVFGDADSSWQALLLHAESVGGQRRNVFLRGFPDSFIQDGAYQGAGPIPTRAMNTNLQTFIKILQAGGWCLWILQATSPTALVASVDVLGNVTTTQAIAATVNAPMQFVRTKYVDGFPVRGIFPVLAVTDAMHFQLKNWIPPVLVGPGKIRLNTYTTSAIALVTIVRAVKRATGRPFSLFRGRARKTR